MSILNIEKKQDSFEKMRLLEEGLLNSKEVIMALEINKIAEAVDLLLEKEPITAFNYRGTVSNYESLPITAELNDAYGVFSENLVYVWNGLGFPTQGNGLNLSIKPLGRVRSGDNSAVSGSEVYKALQPVMHSENYIDFQLAPGQINTETGEIGTSPHRIRTERIPVMASTNYTIRGLGTSVQSLGLNRFFYWNNEEYLGYQGAPLDSQVTFTTHELATHVIILIDQQTDVAADIPNSPYWSSLKLVQGDEITDDYIRAEKLVGNITTDQVKNIEAAIEKFEEAIEVVSELIPLTTAIGAISGSGTTPSDPNYYRTSITNVSGMVEVMSGVDYYYTGAIGTSNRVGVIYKDALLNTLGYDFDAIGNYVGAKCSLPEGTKYLGTSSYLVPPLIESRSIVKAEKSVLYVDGASENENELGTIDKPFKTISAAINSAVGSTTIHVLSGDYREVIPLGILRSGNYKIQAQRGHRVRILGSEKLTGYTKTPGYTNVYEVEYSGTIINATRFGALIYEDGRPSKPIISDQRHPLQKSTSHRLPFSVLTSNVSVEGVDSNPGTFYHDIENSKLYIHTTDGDNPNTNGYSYEVAVRNANTYNLAATQKSVAIALDGLQFYFFNQGLRFVGFSNITRTNVTVMGVAGTAAIQDDTVNVISYNDEVAFCNGDGISGHFNTFVGYDELTDHRSMQPVAIYNDPWCHDNYDDGMSHHENHRVTVFGGLVEYNDDGGIRASNDANYTVYTCYSRYNGLGTSQGEGYSVVNPMVNPYRNGCKMLLYNCIAVGNAIGFASIMDNYNKIELVNCLSRNNGVELKCTHGILISRNTMATNGNPSNVKVVSGEGVIQILNDTLVE